MSEKIFSKILILSVIVSLLMMVCISYAEDTALSKDGYTLEKVVILSRHNIRSPLSTKGSVLDEITPHEWFAWTSPSSQLSLRGGVLETEMGQFFRKWLESEGLIPENYRPEGEEVRFYANSKQRTLATAQYFLAGFLPTSDLDVESHMEFDKMDPVFTPQLIFVSDTYKEYAEAEIRALFTEKIKDLADNYALLADVIDFKDSDAYKNGTFTEFRTDDSEFILDLYAEPGMTGSLKTGCSVSDALLLQYYEEPDELKAGFGHQLSFEQWKDISEIKDVYGDVLFTAPLVAPNVAHPLLQEIRSEMDVDGRVFTFLCGHDSNIGSVLAALKAEEYVLPNVIETKTPIGSKLVFSKWVDKAGNPFWGLDLVFQTPEQLRTMPLLTLENPPHVFPIVLSGLERNQDGLYGEEDILNRLDESIADYDRIVEEYADPVPEEKFEPVLVSEYWTEGSEAAKSLNAYISSVTDKTSADYIPPSDRIAVFDLDGTLMGETDPFCFEYMVFADYALNSGSDTITEEVRAVAQEIIDAVGKAKPDGMSTRQAAAAAIAYQGMTMAELSEIVAEFKNSKVWGFNGMTRGEAFYKPMVELFETLQENDFTVYVVTATERNIVREVVSGVLNIPPSHVIGTEYGYTATGQGAASDADYTFKPSDQIVFDGKYYGENAKTSKVDAIVREIGQQPVLAFGNSSGDLAMEIYTISGNPYKAQAYMVLADDEVREYGDAASAEEKAKSYTAQGIGIISMRDDFETIYGENVTKLSAETEEITEPELIQGWTEDSNAMQSIVTFVTNSVDETSDAFIPKEDRIAVFDMDGTLIGERFPTYFNDWLFINRALYDESYDAPEELKSFAHAWEDKVLKGIPIDDFDAKERELGPQLYEGLTADEYAEVVRKFKGMPVWGFDGMTYGEAYFQPMVSLVKYLYDNDYTIYIVSATYRDAVRIMTEGVLDEYIPFDHVIGTDLLYAASGDENENSMFFELTPEDDLVIAGKLFIKNQKTNKPVMIQQEIGKMPVLAFGNSTGDFSMATYTLQNEKYGGRAYMLLCDDTVRDYGDPEKAAKFKSQCDANGFYTVSMKDEFETLYPENAVILLDSDPENDEQVFVAEVPPQEYEIVQENADVQQEESEEQKTAEKLADELLSAAAKTEPEITAALQSLESESAKLVGLEHRLKSKESLARKILSDAHDMEVSLEEAASGIGDVVRYTFCIDEDQYVPVTDKTLKYLSEKHISVIKFRNRWGGEGYKGINMNLKTADGIIFELQFHTPASFEAKELEHANYEIVRSETATEEEKIAAEAYAKEIYAKVPVPEGAPDYVWKIEQ